MVGQDDFNSASDMNDIYRNMEKLHKKLKDLGVDLDDIDDQLKLYHATEAKRIYQMRQAIVDWERITHYQKERLKANKEEKDLRMRRNMEENAEYFRQIRRNMRMRQSHSTLSEQMNLTTKALFGGGLGLGAVFSQLIKGGKAVADSEEEEADKREDIAQAQGRMREQFAKDPDSEDYRTAKAHAARAQEELIQHLKSPSSRLGKLSIHGKTISDRLANASEFFGTHKLGILLSIGSIGLLVTALKLVYNTSPMMQASVKLLGLMWNLGLRPIGDFFGFVMRPIFIMLLRSFILPWYKYAYPFYQKWGNKIGEFMTSPSWEKLEGILDDIESMSWTDLSLAIAGIAAMLGVGGVFYMSILSLKGAIDWIISKIKPTGVNSAPTSGTGTTTTNPKQPALPAPPNQKALPYYVDPKLKNAGAQGVYEPSKNVGIPQQLKKWMNQQWKRISMAGQKLNQTMGTMWKNFVNKMNTNPITKKLFGMTKKLGAGSLKGGILGFIPAVQEIILEAIDPEKYHRNREEMFEEYPFLRPDFDPSGDHQANALGGIIREPIFGVGKSGKTYSFGEQGAEMITPLGKGVGGGTAITINIQNMSGSQQDLNNLRQTILAVIQESNTRGGRI